MEKIRGFHLTVYVDEDLRFPPRFDCLPTVRCFVYAFYGNPYKGVYNALRRKFGFDHRAGHFRPHGMVDVSPKLIVLQGLRCFYLGRRLPGWPTP